MRLKDKVAIVTGASRGIGEAIARKFCEEGASVMLCSRSTLSVTAADALACEGWNTKSIQADISQKPDVEALVDATLKAFSRIDILVNNAGITRDALLMRMKDDDWDAVLQTNLTGTAYCTRAVIRTMMRQKKWENYQYFIGRRFDGECRTGELCGFKSRYHRFNQIDCKRSC
jgi:3-oxoacyl-[acyl-carrier protein] reductase